MRETYRKYQSYESIKSMNEYYKKKKTLFIENNANEIAKKAKELYSVKQLDSLLEQYLSNTNPTTAINTLEDLIKLRKQRIKKYLQEKEEERRRKEFARINLIKENKAVIAQKRRELEIKYESIFPSLDDLFEIKNLAAAIGKRTYDSDKSQFVNKLSRMGYSLIGDIYADHNTFKNHKGFKIETWKLMNEDGSVKALSSSFTVENVPTDIIETYVMDITSNCRDRFSSRISPWSINQDFEEESPFYAKSGGTLYRYKYQDGKFTVSAWDNSDAKSDVVAEKIGENKIKITPWTNYTHISLKKGDRIDLKAYGSITLGVFSVPCYPNGISGFRTHNIDSRYNHGCLLGKIGKGNWFYVGSEKTIVADRDGLLQLRINDDKESDNDGYFEVNYSFL